MTGQGGHPLAAHRIALICHGRGTDLVTFKGFFDLLEVLEQANIVAEFVGALGQAGQDLQDAAVHFSRIGLAGNRKYIGKTHPCGYTAIQFACLVVLWVVKVSVVGILFPLFIALLVPVRLGLERIFKPEHLALLDAEEEPQEVEDRQAGL